MFQSISAFQFPARAFQFSLLTRKNSDSKKNGLKIIVIFMSMLEYLKEWKGNNPVILLFSIYIGSFRYKWGHVNGRAVWR